MRIRIRKRVRFLAIYLTLFRFQTLKINFSLPGILIMLTTFVYDIHPELIRKF